MKNIFKLLLLGTGILLMYSSCRKVDNLPIYANGTAPVLTASATTIAPTASDSSKVVASFSWSNPKYSTDSATAKYILEIDSSGRNFSKEVTSIVSGTTNISFTGQQLNNMLAGLGLTPGKSFSFDIRVTSSYGNNNEQLKSNVIQVNITSYLIPITVAPSSSNALVLLVANATSPAISFNWNASPFGSTNVISYALQLDTVGGNFANPQVIQYGTALTGSILVNDLNSLAIAAGVLGGSAKNIEFRVVSYLGANYTSPLVYSNPVTVNITTFVPVPANLYIVGDATPMGWTNDATIAPKQQFTRVDAVSYGIIVNLTAGKSYVFVPLAGNWDHKYGGTSATGGALLADGAVPGSNTPAPAASGLYKIVINFQTGSYTVTPYTGGAIPKNLYIVGDATDGGWANPVDTTTQQFTQTNNATFQLTLHFSGSGSYLLLPLNGNWDHKYGGASATGGALLADSAVPGNNTPPPTVDGNYKIVVNFFTNTYTVTKQ